MDDPSCPPAAPIVVLHAGKKKLIEPRKCLFKGLGSKVLVEKQNKFGPGRVQ